MKKTLYLNVVDTHQQIFHGEVMDVTVSGTMGGLTILAGHTQLLSTLKPGEMHYTTADGVLESLFVSGGVIEVQPSVVTILADTIIRSSELDAEAAKESMERAKHDIKAVKIGSEAYQELAREMQIMTELIKLARITNRLGIRRH
ncbi:MAG TPA: ATP synthase F1 subunit epsilon [Leucothrix mucor]|uniref:ATP synthase epsilon chain n=1 Tax=Leucothrix mucor TaxID=45248 RepID=A0A7V2SZX2_LEUMU|nr:ATP synthase F1 subunit epsilon [Leucothrix mucor]